MSVIKKAIRIGDIVEFDTLNKPQSWTEFNLSKFASTNIRSEGLGGFDLKEAIAKNPDHLFAKIFAIKKDEVNDNGDSFPADELKKAAKTFIGVPIFCNHQNDDVEKARGKCVHAWYDEERGGIYIISMVDRVAYPKLARGIEQGYVNGCFPGDAPVLMADGTEKCIADIEDGDSVISGSGNIRKVLGKREKNYNYPLFSITVDGIKDPLICTSYHNVYTYKLQDICSCGCQEPLTVLKDSRITDKTFNRKFIKNHYWNGEKYNHQNIQKVKANELEIGDFLIEPKFNNVVYSELTDDQCFLIGLFAAEGSFEKRKGIRHSVIFSFSHKERDTLAFQCSEKLDTVFSDYRNSSTTNFYPDASQTRVSLYGKEVADWFYKYTGEYSDKKKFDISLLNLNESQTASLLAGYVEGDGYTVKGKCFGIATVSQDLASQLRILFAKIGIRTRYRIVKNTGDWGYKPVHEIVFGITTADILRKKLIYKIAKKNEHNKASWHDLKDIVLRRIKKIEQIDYDGKIYDLEIDEDHSYCVNHIAVSNTSMGCSVEYSICSICHKKAHVADEYCEHVKNQKNRKYSGEITCQFHKDSSNKDENCPICGSSAESPKNLKYSNERIYEHNYGVKFIEDSFVVNPACHDCLVEDILNIAEFSRKVASLKDKVEKISSCPTGVCNLNNNMVKAAGKQEIDDLNEAMDKIERVAKSMMSQKTHVSMEYVSDLVDALASVQSITDELIEMGYVQLPSPTTGVENVELPKTSNDIVENKEITSPQPQMQPQTQPQIQVPTPSGVSSESVGELGSITKPKFSSEKIEKNIGKKEDFLPKFSNLKEQIVILQSILDKAIIDSDVNSKNKESIIMDNNKVSETENLNVKVAENRNDVITEKQLEDGGKEAINKRINKSPDVILEKELDKTPYTKVNITNSDSPSERSGSYETITENQLETVKSINAARWNEFPEVITEKQWTEWNRAVGSVLSQSQDDIITEKQLTDFLGKHRYVTDLDVITEKQLESAKTTQTNRWAYSYNPSTLVKKAEESISDAIAYYNKTPDEILSAASFLNDSPKNLDKAALLVLLNALPNKEANRKNDKSRYNYFSKLASSEVKTPNVVDSLIVSMSDHIGDVSADDLIQAVKHVASNKVSMKRVNDLVAKKLSSNVDVVKPLDKVAQLDSAIIDLNKESDGVYQVHASLEEIGINPTDKKAFLKGVVKVANQEIEKEIGVNINAGLIKVDLDQENGVVVATLKDPNMLTDQEKDALVKTYKWMNSKNEDKVAKDERDVSKTEEASDTPSKKTEVKASVKREALIKEAQLFGGEMGGQGGASQAPGAGATLPQPPAAGGAAAQPPLESFEQSDLSLDSEDDTGSMQPKPPGTMCAVCGSDDVDVVKGEGKCNNCGAEFQYKVTIDITKYPGIMDNSTTDENQDVEESKLEEVPAGLPQGEGFALPEGGEAPVGMPAAASINNKLVRKFAGFAMMTKLKPEVIAKVAEKSKNIKLGSVSPITGSANTFQLEPGKYVCLDSGIPYTVSYAVQNDNPKNVYAEWRWNPISSVECGDCSRAKRAFVESLKTMGMEEGAFDALSLKEKGKTILAMKEKGLFKQIKIASENKSDSVIANYKKAYGEFGDKFPVESCIEKLARRYGKDALALSGPCEGKPLADCVCGSLKKAGVYSNGLAVKVAEIWGDKQGTVECLEDCIRNGFDLKQSSSICEALKAKYAQFDDVFVDELENDVVTDDNGPDGEDMDVVVDVGEEIDPFDDDTADAGTITVNLPLEVIEQVDRAIDVALGENPEDEEHHTEDLPDVDVEVEVPTDAAEAIDEVADEALDQNLGVEEENEDIVDELDSDIIDEATPEVEHEVVDVIEDESSIIGDDIEEDVDVESGSKKGPGIPDGTGPGKNSDECPFNREKNKGDEEEDSESDEEESDEEEDSPADEGEEFKKGQDQMDNETDMNEMETQANAMKAGYIGHTGEVNLDLSGVLAILNKKAADDGVVKTKQLSDKSKGVVQENAQDTKEIQPISGKSAIGQEDEFSADQPDVPSGDGKIGKEQPPKEIKPVKIPVGSEPMGNEELEGGDDRTTGGEQGAGSSKAANVKSTREKLANLADRIVQAGEKKVKPKAPVSEDKDIQPISGGEKSKIGKEETIKEKKITDKEVKTKDGFLGKEKESLGEKPDDPKDQPSIPAGGGKMKNEKLDPEKQDHDKGTVIANSDKESKSSINNSKEAFRIAGRMISEGILDPQNLETKVAELIRYEIPQLKDIEKSIFSGRKGLNAASDGLEQSVVINETSNQRKAQTEISDKLSSLFSLTEQNDLAQKTDIEMRKAFGR